MQDRVAIFVSMALAMITTASVVLAQAVAPASEYAYGWAIAAEPDADFQEIVLPLEFYQSVSDPELRDVGVYNAKGVAVPRLIRPKVPLVRNLEQRQTLRVLPVYKPKSGDGSGGKLMFQQRGGETILTYDGVDAAAASSEHTLAAYVIDAKSVGKALRRLEFDWPDGLDSFIGYMTVHGSNDLENWRELGKGSIADLTADDAGVSRKFLALSGPRRDFLRLTWRGVPPGWSITSVEGLFWLKERRASSSSLTITPVSPTGRDENDNGYIFDLGGAPNVDRIQLNLPPDNTVIRADLFSAQTQSDPWRPVGNRLFFNLRRNGNTVRNEAS